MDDEFPDKIAYRMDEAARASGLSRSVLYLEMASGALPSLKACGRRLILRKDLEAFLEGHKSSAVRS